MATSIVPTTASVAVTDAAEQITLASVANATVDGKLFVDGELMHVQSISGSVCYVRRGQDGTRRRPHASGVTVWPGLAGAFRKDPPFGRGSAAAELWLPRLCTSGFDGTGRIFTLGGADGTEWVEVALESTGGRKEAKHLRTRVTIAQINAGVTLLAAMVGFGYRMVDAYMIAVGGAAAAVTSLDINGTLTSSRKLVAFLVAGLTQSTLLRAGAATNGVILADGASFTRNDLNTAISALKTGADVTTATHLDIGFEYVIE